jgi:predicted  nucleic acid-binding Zn-ribbon protein
MSADATIQRAIAELEAERQDIEKKIATLRSALTPNPDRRTAVKDAVNGNRRRRRRSMGAAARKAVSARMKKYWAERRKAEAK